MIVLTQYDGSVDDSWNFGTTASEAQGFQVPSATNCTGFEIRGSRGNSASGTTFTIEVRSGASPTSGTLVYSEQFDLTEIPAYTASPTFYSLKFATPVALAAGTQYYLRQIADGGSASDELRWSVDTTSPSYASGAQWSGATENTGRDHNFRILSGGVTRDSVSTAAGGSGLTSLTWSHTNSGDILRVSAFIDGGSPSEVLSGITYPKGGTPTALTFVSKLQRAAPDSNAWTYIYELIAPDTGTHNIVVSTSASAFIGLAIGRSYKGASATQPHNHNEGSQHLAGTSISRAVTTTVDNSWVEAYGYGDNGGIGVGTGMQTAFGTISDVSIAGDSQAIVTPAGSYTLGITALNGNLGVMVCDIAPSTIIESNLTESVAPADRLTRVSLTSKSDPVNAVDVRSMKPVLGRVEAAAIADLLTSFKIKFKQLSDPVAVLDTLSRTLSRVAAEAVAVSSSFIRVLAYGIQHSVAVVAQPLLSLNGTVTNQWAKVAKAAGDLWRRIDSETW